MYETARLGVSWAAMAVKGSGASASGMVHLLAGFGVFTGVAGSTGLVDVAGLAGLPDLIDSTGFARLAVFAGLLALLALFLSECVELAHSRPFLVVPPGWWGAVARLPGVEADQVGAAGCELLGYHVCFGGGEVGGWASLP